jgi:hypothetical protein
MLWHKRCATSEMGRNIMSGRSQRMTFEIRHSENLEHSVSLAPLVLLSYPALAVTAQPC